MNIKFKIWEMALIIALVVSILCGFSLEKESDELASKLIRLHVVANSNSEEDQSLKLKVRDRILDVLETELEGITDRTEAERIIKSNLDKLIDESKDEISDNFGEIGRWR